MTASKSVRRVYLVVWWFDRLGGMERHVTEIALSLARTGIEIILFSELPLLRSNAYGRTLRSAGIRVVAPGQLRGMARQLEIGRYRTGRALHHLEQLTYRARRQVSTPRADRDVLTFAQQAVHERGDYNLLTRHILRALARHAQQSPPDVIHVHGCRLGQDWIIQWAAAHGYPTVYTEHTTIGDWDGPWHPEGAQIVSETADVLACVSETARSSLLANLSMPRNIPLTRHIVRGPAQYRHSAVLEKASNPPYVLCVARLSHHKGIDILLDALAILRKQGVVAQLRIAGDGDERQKLEQQASRLGLSEVVDFLGNVDSARIGKLWDSSSFGVLPSRTEGLPLSLIEAMAHGRTIVGTRVGGIPEVIQHEENGLLVADNDSPALAAAMRLLLDDPELACRLGTSARHSFETGGWSEQEVTEHTLSLYEQARAGFIRKTDWVYQRTLAAASGVRRVFFVAWGLSSFGDMEHAIAQQASALASAGVEVFLFLDRPASLTNRYLFRMRRAGVRTFVPSRLRRGISRLANSRSSYAASSLERECARGVPDVIHVHGWRAGRPWTAVTLASRAAKQHGIPLVYTEHYGEEREPQEHNPDVSFPSEVSAWSAVSPGARDYLTGVLAGQTPPVLLRHLEPERSDAPQPSTGKDFRVLAFVSSENDEAFLNREFEMAREQCRGVDLTLLTQKAPEPLDALPDFDAALFSQNSDSFASALAETMALYRPIIACGDLQRTPLRHRANAWAASWLAPGEVAEAIVKMATDPLLAHALGIAARRTFESSGNCELAIVAQAAALYRRARAV